MWKLEIEEEGVKIGMRCKKAENGLGQPWYQIVIMKNHYHEWWLLDTVIPCGSTPQVRFLLTLE